MLGLSSASYYDYLRAKISGIYIIWVYTTKPDLSVALLSCLETFNLLGVISYSISLGYGLISRLLVSIIGGRLVSTS